MIPYKSGTAAGSRVRAARRTIRTLESRARRLLLSAYRIATSFDPTPDDEATGVVFLSELRRCVAGWSSARADPGNFAVRAAGTLARSEQTLTSPAGDIRLTSMESVDGARIRRVVVYADLPDPIIQSRDAGALLDDGIRGMGATGNGPSRARSRSPSTGIRAERCGFTVDPSLRGRAAGPGRGADLPGRSPSLRGDHRRPGLRCHRGGTRAFRQVVRAGAQSRRGRGHHDLSTRRPGRRTSPERDGPDESAGSPGGTTRPGATARRSVPPTATAPEGPATGRCGRGHAPTDQAAEPTPVAPRPAPGRQQYPETQAAAARGCLSRPDAPRRRREGRASG